MNVYDTKFHLEKCSTNSGCMSWLLSTEDQTGSPFFSESGTKLFLAPKRVIFGIISTNLSNCRIMAASIENFDQRKSDTRSGYSQSVLLSY